MCTESTKEYTKINMVGSTKIFIVKDRSSIDVHANMHISLKALVPLFDILSPAGEFSYMKTIVII